MEFDTQKALLRLRGQLPVYQEAAQRPAPVAQTYQQQVPCYDVQIPVLQQPQAEATVQVGGSPRTHNLGLSARIPPPAADTRKPFVPRTRITKSTYQ